MPETETSNYSEKIEQQFDPELLKENIEILNTIKESFSNQLTPFYLDTECQIQAYAYRFQPKDSQKIYTIPTDADYVVLSQYGATVFKLYNITNPENPDDTRRYDPSDLTQTGLATITRYLINHSKDHTVISEAIEQEDKSKQIFQVVGVYLANLLTIYCSEDLFLRNIDGQDRQEWDKQERIQQKLQRKLNRLSR